LKKIILAGNHGLEALIGRKKLVHPNAKNIRTNLKLLFGKIYSKTSFIKGLLVENKGLSGSLHYRNVSSQYLKFVYSLERTLKQKSRELGFILRRGKKVLELVPNSTWHKGLFVEKIKKYFKDPFVIYIGDDVTDEDAFHVVRSFGVAIRVGRKKRSLAPYYLKSQKDVPILLKRMVSLWN
jgi:trehalose-phosphatase